MVPLGLRGPKPRTEPRVRIVGYVDAATSKRLDLHGAQHDWTVGEVIDEAVALLDQADARTAELHRVKAEADVAERAHLEIIREQKRTIAAQAQALARVGVRRRRKAMKPSPAGEQVRLACSECRTAPVPPAAAAEGSTMCGDCTDYMAGWASRAAVTPCAAGCGGMMDPPGLSLGERECVDCRGRRRAALEAARQGHPEASSVAAGQASGSRLQAPPAPLT